MGRLIVSCNGIGIVGRKGLELWISEPVRKTLGDPVKFGEARPTNPPTM
jgi:hypothetical protein